MGSRQKKSRGATSKKASSFINLDKAPNDTQEVIIPGEHVASRDVHVNAPIIPGVTPPKNVVVEDGKRKICRKKTPGQKGGKEKGQEKVKGSNLEDNVTNDLPQDKNLEFLEDLENEALFEDDLAPEPQPELPGPYTAERPRGRYNQACNLLKIVPSSKFSNGLNSGRVIARHQGLGPLGAKAVTFSLQTSLKVTELFLGNNNIGPQGMIYIAQLIQDNEVIKVLDISDNNLGREGAKVLAAAIRDNGSIHQINASGNKFDDPTGEYFYEAFKVNSTIRQVDFSRNFFSELGPINICMALEHNTTVTHLDFSYNHIRRLGVKGIAKMLKVNESLMQLDLSWNGIDMDGAMQLGQGLNCNNSLVVLNLSGCRLIVASLMKMLGNMKDNTTLKTLQIPHNPMTNADLTVFLRAIQSLPDIAIGFLDASTVMVSQDFQNLVKQVEKEKPGFMVTTMGLLGIQDHSHNMLEMMDLVGGDPLEAIVSYARRRNLRLLDIFARFDTDKSGTVTRDELIMGVADAGIPLSLKQLDRLVAKLDMDGDGEVDFAELLAGYRRLVKRLRKEGRVARDYLNEENEMFPGLSKAIKDTTEDSEELEEEKSKKMLRRRSSGKRLSLTGEWDSSRRRSSKRGSLRRGSSFREGSGSGTLQVSLSEIVETSGTFSEIQIRRRSISENDISSPPLSDLEPLLPEL